jgi:hypothetical protein
MPKRFVPIPITKIYFAMGFDDLNIWAERFEEIIEGLISGGIINFLVEKMTKSKWNLLKIQERSEKIVLNLSHLGFGFQICFFALYTALLVFILELFVFWTIKIVNKSKQTLNQTPVSVRNEPCSTGSPDNLDLTLETISHEDVSDEHAELSCRVSSSSSKRDVEMLFGEKTVHNIEENTKNVEILFLSDLID